MNRFTICIPIPPAGHPMLEECIRNVKDTTGVSPVVLSCDGNVSMARDLATREIDSEFICFLDSDAFPQEKNWISTLIATADEFRADIVSPQEVLWFPGDSKRPLSFADEKRTAPFVVDQPDVAGMCLLVRRGAGAWDRNCGLTAGFLGPCVEDTDFAHSIRDAGGIHARNPLVHVLHKDRGADSIEEWMRSHEFLCYGIMCDLIRAKWMPGRVHLRGDFFKNIGKLPASGQRYLEKGCPIGRLAECFMPVIDAFPSDERSILSRMIEERIDLFRKETEPDTTVYAPIVRRRTGEGIRKDASMHRHCTSPASPP